MSFEVDTRQFEQAMQEYSAASGKDFAEIVNRQVNNVAVQGVMKTREAERSAINTLKDQDWWPKLIAKIISKSGKTFAKKAYQSMWAKGEARIGRRTLTKTESAYAKYAETLSTKIAKRRLVAVKFLKFFFATLSNAVAPHIPGGKVKKIGKTFAGMEPNIKLATPADPTCTFSVKYQYKKRHTSDKANYLLNQALQDAINFAVIDMQKYIDRKMAETARRFSAV